MIAYSDNRPDEELVALYRNSHDTSYVNELFVRYYLFIYATSKSYLHEEKYAKDVTIQFHKFLRDDLRKHGVRNFRAWLLFAVKWMCYKEANKLNLASKTELEKQFGKEKLEDALYVDDKNTPILPEKDFLKELEAGKITLKPVDRELIDAFYYQKKTLDELVESSNLNRQELIEKLYTIRSGKYGKK